MVPRKTHYKNDCWICDGHVFSVLFWSRGRALRLNPIFNQEDAEPIRFEIDSVDIEDPGLGHVDGSLPYD